MPDMDKSMPGDSEAGDALAGGAQVGDAKTITIPADLLPGCKAGDTYTVKSMDNDNVTLEAVPSGADDGESTEKWGQDAIAHVNKGGM